MADELPVRNCDECGIEDTDPRHVTYRDDGSVLTRHLDCCRDAGCPTDSCGEVTAGAEDLRGDELREYLTSRSE